MADHVYFPCFGSDAFAAAVHGINTQPANIDPMKERLQEAIGGQSDLHQRRHVAGWLK